MGPNESGNWEICVYTDFRYESSPTGISRPPRWDELSKENGVVESRVDVENLTKMSKPGEDTVVEHKSPVSAIMAWSLLCLSTNVWNIYFFRWHRLWVCTSFQLSFFVVTAGESCMRMCPEMGTLVKHLNLLLHSFRMHTGASNLKASWEWWLDATMPWWGNKVEWGPSVYS